MTVPVPEYRIDPETLREVLIDPDQAVRYVDVVRAGGRCAELVPWLRMLGEVEQAERIGRKALADRGGPASAQGAAAALRLAHVLHWQEDFRAADELFDTVRSFLESWDGSPQWASAMLAFTDQHQGKARFDEGRWEEAREMFRSALDRRIGNGAPEDQLASTRIALDAVEKRLRAD